MGKVICVIQAHTTSTRLPKKVLKTLGNKIMLHHVVERVKQANQVDDVIIATTIEPEDDGIVEFCEANNIHYYRGSDKNVLERYVGAVNQFDGDIIIRITSDCPLIEPKIIDQVVSFFKENNFDYVSPSTDMGLIRGLDTEVFSADALYKAKDLACEDSHFEHVTLYMYKHPDKFNIGRPEIDDIYKDSNIRLCVDEVDDFKLIEHLYHHFYNGKNIVDLAQCLQYVRENHQVRDINKNVLQKHA